MQTNYVSETKVKKQSSVNEMKLWISTMLEQFDL